jgi:acyl-CoA thioesterase YciA
MQIPALKAVMMPRDTNAMGTIFGGVILSHIDLAGAEEARTHGIHKYVTVAMENVVFKKPIYVGDTVSYFTETLRVGNTSVTVKVSVKATNRHIDEAERDVTEATLTYVAVDEDRNPTPIKG